jgi:hypothetical protein
MVLDGPENLTGVIWCIFPKNNTMHYQICKKHQWIDLFQADQTKEKNPYVAASEVTKGKMPVSSV